MRCSSMPTFPQYSDGLRHAKVSLPLCFNGLIVLGGFTALFASVVFLTTKNLGEGRFGLIPGIDIWALV